MKSFYEASTEQKMQAYFTAISRLFGLQRKVIYKGIRELSNPILMEQIPKGKQRRPGGGRKKKKKK